MTGETVLATTDSNPPSTFAWYDSTRIGAFHTGDELTFESNMTGRAWVVVVKAVNIVGGERRATSTMIQFRVTGIHMTTLSDIMLLSNLKLHNSQTVRNV